MLMGDFPENETCTTVGCCNVFFPVNACPRVQRLSDSLVVSLRTALVGNLKTVETYVESSMQRLTQRPTSVEDIGRAKKEWKEISDSKATMRTQFRCVALLLVVVVALLVVAVSRRVFGTSRFSRVVR